MHYFLTPFYALQSFFRQLYIFHFKVDSVVISKEQMVTINGIASKIKFGNYFSIIQDKKTKTLSVMVQGEHPQYDNSKFITDPIWVDVNGSTKADLTKDPVDTVH